MYNIMFVSFVSYLRLINEISVETNWDAISNLINDPFVL